MKKGSGSKSFAGASDYADNDPIRVTCDDNDTVCGKDNTLGLVLPVLLPDVPGVATTDTFPTVASCAEIFVPGIGQGLYAISMYVEVRRSWNRRDGSLVDVDVHVKF